MNTFNRIKPPPVRRPLATDQVYRDLARDIAVEISRELSQARQAVAPYVGDLVDCHSAEDVYREALRRLDVDDADTMPVEALAAVLQAQPLPGTAQDKALRAYRAGQKAMAADAAAPLKSFEERFPGSARLLNGR